MTKKRLIFIVAPLFVATLLLRIVYSIDDSDFMAWWPFVVFSDMLQILFYTWLFVLVEKIHVSSQRYVLIYNTLFAGIYFVVYALSVRILKTIDWLAVNEGRVELTQYQKLAHDYNLFFWLMILFLCIHLGSVYIQKNVFKTNISTLEEMDKLPKNFGYYSWAVVILSIFCFYVFFL